MITISRRGERGIYDQQPTSLSAQLAWPLAAEASVTRMGSESGSMARAKAVLGLLHHTHRIHKDDKMYCPCKLTVTITINGYSYT